MDFDCLFWYDSCFLSKRCFLVKAIHSKGSRSNVFVMSLEKSIRIKSNDQVVSRKLWNRSSASCEIIRNFFLIPVRRVRLTRPRSLQLSRAKDCYHLISLSISLLDFCCYDYKMTHFVLTPKERIEENKEETEDIFCLARDWKKKRKTFASESNPMIIPCIAILWLEFLSRYKEQNFHGQASEPTHKGTAVRTDYSDLYFNFRIRDSKKGQRRKERRETEGDSCLLPVILCRFLFPLIRILFSFFPPSSFFLHHLLKKSSSSPTRNPL